MVLNASLAIANTCRESRSFETYVAPRSDFILQGDIALHPKLVLDGWAAGYRVTYDGRRQVTKVYLPGDLVGAWRSSQSSFHHSVMAVTRLSLKTLTIFPDPSILQRECALVERLLENSVFRLGCLNAYERIAHLFLELGDRLERRSLGLRNAYRMPLTQELLACLVGMSPVHINRTLQQLKADRAISLTNTRLEILQPDLLADMVSYDAL